MGTGKLSGKPDVMLEGGSELAMDLHPIQGVGVITWSFHSKETRIGTGWVGHLVPAGWATWLQHRLHLIRFSSLEENGSF